MMNRLFEERARSYFGKRAEEFLKLAGEAPTQAFFLNRKKADEETIFSMIGFPYETSSLSNESFYHNEENIGKTIAYETGLIYPQELAASLTSSCIDIEDIKLVVDLCAAPGGKTINILNRLESDVLCISNEVSHSRSLILSSNLERLGLDNVVITNKNCEELSGQLEEKADLVILDAPCSGEGMIRKYPEILDSYSLRNIENLAELQKDLLECAWKILKQGGQLIYSTCTFAFEEDEDQISSFLSRHPDMRIIEINIPSSSKLKGTVKLSFLDRTEGQFFCLLKKEGQLKTTCLKELKPIKEKTADDFIKENLQLEEYLLYKNNGHLYLSLMPLPDMKNGVIRYGIYAGDIVKNRFEPAHHLYRANSLKGKYRYTYDLSDLEYAQFVSGREIKADLGDHYYQLTYRNISVGFGKCVKGIIKNKYPKGLRRMI